MPEKYRGKFIYYPRNEGSFQVGLLYVLVGTPSMDQSMFRENLSLKYN